MNIRKIIREEIDSDWDWASTYRSEVEPNISLGLQKYLGERYNWHYMVLIPKDGKNIVKLYIDEDSYPELDHPHIDIMIFDDWEDYNEQQGEGKNVGELVQNSGGMDLVGQSLEGLRPVPNDVFNEISKEIPNLGWALVDIMGM
jgi:hypothetical protein